MASVALEGVCKAYPGDVTAVDGLDLEIHNREFVVLLGPSGCGKSTTLRLIAGLEEATKGRIRIGDQVVNHVAPKDRNIAMVFQNYALYPHMSAYKNMAFGLELRYRSGWLARIWTRLTNPSEAAAWASKRRGIKPQVRQTAQVLGIEHLLDRMPRQLSGGERQRVALGRAMVRQPAVFLFDEPLSNLDAKLRLEMRRELHQLHRRLQTTMIYVTHDQTEAMTLGERIAVMDQGVLQQVGTPMDIYDRPQTRFVAGFIGSPPMNFVGGRLEPNGGAVRFRRHGWTLDLPAGRVAENGTEQRDVELGVRPEDLHVTPAAAPAASGAAAEGSVLMIESLGDYSLAYVEIAGDSSAGKNNGNSTYTLVCKTEPRTRLSPGERVRVTFDPDRVHLFDGRTGGNLIRAES